VNAVVCEKPLAVAVADVDDPRIEQVVLHPDGVPASR
jgi:hypothetical protein